MTTPQQPVPPPAPGGRGRGIVATVGGPRNAAIIGAGLSVAAVALFSSMRSKSSSNGTTLMSSGDFDSSPYDMWNAWQSEYEDLQQQINANGGSTSASGPGTPSPPPPVPIPKPPVPTPAPKPPAPKPKPKPTGHKVVTVKHGDTLSGIAERNHISMARLKKLNPVYWTNKKYRNGNLIWAGDKVTVS